MRSVIHVVAGASILFGAANAFAQQAVEDESQGADHSVPAVSRALEIAVGGGYLQGVGDIADKGARIQDLSGPGGTVELQVGYRATPNLAFGGYGSFSQFGTGDDVAAGTDVRSVSAGAY